MPLDVARILSVSALLLASADLAVAQCSALNGTLSGPGAFYVVNGTLIPMKDGKNDLPVRKQAEIAYVVPAANFTSGALVVKVRHFLEKPINVVRLTRPAHKSACYEKPVGKYKRLITLDQYERYHGYGLSDLDPNTERNLNTFHADVGLRPGLFREYCRQTNDSAIRTQFSFDNPSGIAVVDLVTRITVNIVGTLRGGPAPAVAGDFPPSLADHSARVVPYRRIAGQLLCVSVKIPVPANIQHSQITIVDADTAATIVNFVQTTWQVEWQK